MPKLIGKPPVQIYDLSKYGCSISNDLLTMTCSDIIAMLFSGQPTADNLLGVNVPVNRAGTKAVFGYLPNNCKFVCYACGDVLGVLVNSETLRMFVNYGVCKTRADMPYWFSPRYPLTASEAVDFGKVMNFFNNLPMKKTVKRWAFKQKEGDLFFPPKPQHRQAAISYCTWEVNNA